FLLYGERKLPIAPGTYRYVLEITLKNLAGQKDEDFYAGLQSILTALEYLPKRTEADPKRITERIREKEIIKRRLERLCAEAPQVEGGLVKPAEKATAHAGVAMGRAILTDRIGTAAETDGLTGVANRRRFDSVLEAELQRASQVAVLLVDRDHFKSVNDEHGHLVGDEVLRQAAHAIQAASRGRGLVAR